MESHAKSCSDSQLRTVRQTKNGFELIDEVLCETCQARFSKRGSADIAQKPGKLNNAKSELNVSVATVMFCHGITAQQGHEFFSQVGVQSPLPRNILRMQETVKSEIMSLAREVLMDNRKRHNVACRSKPGYKGDVVWTYKDDGVERRAARGPITGDGGGLTERTTIELLAANIVL